MLLVPAFGSYGIILRSESHSGIVHGEYVIRRRQGWDVVNTMEKRRKVWDLDVDRQSVRTGCKGINLADWLLSIIRDVGLLMLL